MKTCYYANPKLKNGNYELIAISAGIPKYNTNVRYIRYPPLTPTWNMIREAKKGNKEYYWTKFEKMLSNLDPHTTYLEIINIAGIHEPVLLCWEKDINSCHRKRVAEWFAEAGFTVNEL